MNTNKQKNYLVIKNVCLDKNLKEYLEQICQDEHVNILYEEFNQFDVWNQKQSVYAEFNAKPSFDILLWSYDSIKLEYINYLYNDFEARYRNTGKVVSRIIESADNGGNLDEGEKLDISIRDDLSSGWTINWNFSNYLQSDLNSEQKRSLREKLASWATGDWAIDKSNKKLTLIQKISNFYNKYSEKIIYFGIGFATCDIVFLFLVLTLKHFMVK